MEHRDGVRAPPSLCEEVKGCRVWGGVQGMRLATVWQRGATPRKLRGYPPSFHPGQVEIDEFQAVPRY